MSHPSLSHLCMIAILIRHALAASGAFLAAHGATVDDPNSLTALLTGLLLWLLSVLWSWFSKLDWLPVSYAPKLSRDEKAVGRKLIAALVSQGVAALAGVVEQQGFSGNPDDATALIIFCANLAVSRAGLWQQPLGVQAVKVLLFCLLPMQLVCCTLTPQQQQVVQQLIIPLGQVGLKALVARGVLAPNDALLIGEGAATILSDGTKAERLVRLSDLGLEAAAERGLIQPGDVLTVKEATSIIQRASQSAPKQPINVQPVNSPPEAGDTREFIS